MADGYKLWGICPQCKGIGKNTKFTGTDEQNPGSLQNVNCPTCFGKKYVFLGWCSVDTTVLPVDLPTEP